MGDRQETAAEKAEYYFTHGYNCAQSVLIAVGDAYDDKIPDELVDAAVGFSGGLGYSGCICGALNGGVLALSHFLRKQDRDLNKRSIARTCGRFSNWFEEEFATRCCLQLRRRRPFSSVEVKAMCTGLAKKTAEKVVETIDAD